MRHGLGGFLEQGCFGSIAYLSYDAVGRGLGVAVRQGLSGFLEQGCFGSIAYLSYDVVERSWEWRCAKVSAGSWNRIALVQ